MSGITVTMVAMTSITTDKLRSDFDFFVGSWDVRHQRLRVPLTGSPDDWYSFTGTCAARTYLDGAVSFDEVAIPEHGWSGASLRLRDPNTGAWLIYWVNSRDGVVQPPVQGEWVDGGCRLLGDDVHDGTPIRVTYEWSDIGEQSARWQQAYSADGERTWETNLGDGLSAYRARAGRRHHRAPAEGDRRLRLPHRGLAGCQSEA